MNRSILFVDDNDLLRTIFIKPLCDAGFQVVEANNATSCMAALDKKTPDLVLLDIMMTPVDGWNTLRQIRKHPHAAKVPVLMFSGKAILPNDIIENGSQIDGFLKKPFKNAFLISSLTDFFVWYTELKNHCDTALDSGSNPDDVSRFFSLKREERAINQMYQLFSSGFENNNSSFTDTMMHETFQEVETYIRDLKQKIQSVEAELITPVS